MKNRKTAVTYAIFDAALVVFFFFTSPSRDILTRTADAVFMACLISVLGGLCCLVRNGGIFRSFSYLAYRSKKKNLQKRIEMGLLPQDTEIFNFAEYNLEKYGKKWNGIPLYINGGVLAVICAILYFIA